MKQLCLLLLLLLTYSFSFAQKNFREGFVVLKGDTLEGYIDYRGVQRSAGSVTFRQGLNGAEQQYMPGEVTAYGLKEERILFEAKRVPALDSASSLRVRFLKVLVKGRASLFYNLDSTGKDRYYLLKGNGPLTALEMREYYKQDPRTYRTYKVESKVYVGTLAMMFNDCSEMTASQLGHVKLTAKSLISITSKYNQCIAPFGSTYEGMESKAKVTLGIVATYFRPSLKFTGDSYLSGASFTTEGVKAGGGISLNFAIPRVNEKLSIHTELLYVPSRFTATLKENGSSAYAYNHDIEFDLAYLKLPAQLRYTYPLGVLRPYANAGVVLGYAVKDGNKATRTSNSGSGSPIETTPALLPHEEGFRHFLQGYTVGAGLLYPLHRHALSLEARYEGNNGFSYFNGVVSTVNTFYVLLGYSF